MADASLAFLFLKGAAVGLSVAAPIGPIGILCIRQTVAYGFWGGILSGTAASIADAIYTLGVGLFSVAFSNFTKEHDNLINLLAAGFLAYIAYKIYKTKSEGNALKQESRNLWGNFLYTFVLSFLSPVTTFLFISMFQSYNVFDHDLSLNEVVILAFGVAVGSMVWWCVLAGIVNKVQLISPQITVPKLGIDFLFKGMWQESAGPRKVELFIFVNRLSAILLLIYAFMALTRIV